MPQRGVGPAGVFTHTLPRVFLYLPNGFPIYSWCIPLYLPYGFPHSLSCVPSLPTQVYCVVLLVSNILSLTVSMRLVVHWFFPPGRVKFIVPLKHGWTCEWTYEWKNRGMYEETDKEIHEWTSAVRSRENSQQNSRGTQDGSYKGAHEYIHWRTHEERRGKSRMGGREGGISQKSLLYCPQVVLA